MAAGRPDISRQGGVVPGAPAGSNQVGASEICTAQVSCPSGLAASAVPCPAAAIPTAERTSSPRRVRSDGAAPSALPVPPPSDEWILVFPPILASQLACFHRVLRSTSEQVQRDFLTSLCAASGGRQKAASTKCVLPDALSGARSLRTPRRPGRASLPRLRP